MFYDKFIYYIRDKKSSPAQAYEYVATNGMFYEELQEMIYSENTIQNAWYTSILLYMRTQNKSLTLYERCYAERQMRSSWRFFEKRHVYKEPTVPPLPE